MPLKPAAYCSPTPSLSNWHGPALSRPYPPIPVINPSLFSPLHILTPLELPPSSHPHHCCFIHPTITRGPFSPQIRVLSAYNYSPTIFQSLSLSLELISKIMVPESSTQDIFFSTANSYPPVLHYFPCKSLQLSIKMFGLISQSQQHRTSLRAPWRSTESVNDSILQAGHQEAADAITKDRGHTDIPNWSEETDPAPPQFWEVSSKA